MKGSEKRLVEGQAREMVESYRCCPVCEYPLDLDAADHIHEGANTEYMFCPECHHDYEITYRVSDLQVNVTEREQC